MSLQANEPPGARERTQTLRTLPELTDAVSVPEAADGEDHGRTLYLAFDTPLPDSVVSEITPDDTIARARAATDAATANSEDPAQLVQIQALELAANRAEIARQQREIEELQRSLRVREGLLEELRAELKTANEERKLLAGQLSDARAQLERLTNTIAKQQNQIAALEAQAADRMSATEYASESGKSKALVRAEYVEKNRVAYLEPMDDDSAPIILNRKLMTVGRTRDSDICVPSALVSRDHARILIGEDGVVVFDVGSINGCFVNDQLVRRHVLQDGDVLRFADRSYRFTR